MYETVGNRGGGLGYFGGNRRARMQEVESGVRGTKEEQLNILQLMDFLKCWGWTCWKAASWKDEEAKIVSRVVSRGTGRILEREH